MIGYEYHVLIFKYNKILFLHLMNIININLEHCFGITKLSQKLNFAGENVVLIYAPNGLMKTSFARTMQLYGQGKADKVKDVVANRWDYSYQGRTGQCRITNLTICFQL